MPSTRPPKLVTFSIRTSSPRLASICASGFALGVIFAHSSVTRRRSHLSAADGAGAGAGVVRASAGRAARRGANAAGARLVRLYLSIRARSVLREIPSSDAEREMFQLVWRRTSATRSRTASSSERAVSSRAGSGSFPGAVTGSPSISGVTSASSDKSATRSMRLPTSRTLPGHG